MTKNRLPVAAVIVAAAIVVALIVALVTDSLVPVAIAVVPWFAAVRVRAGGVIAVVATVFGALITALYVLFVTPYLPINMGLAVAVAASALGLWGAWIARHDMARAVSRSDLRYVGLALGPVVWLLVLVGARWHRGANPIAWAMQGDAANNVLLARGVLLDGGLFASAAANPVPLPAGGVAALMALGRESVADADLATFDVSHFANAWLVLILTLSVLTGVALAALSALASRKLVPLAAAVGSLLSCTWFFVGYPLEFGFINTQFAIVVCAGCVAMLAVLRERAPWVAGLGLIGGTLAFASWGPIVVVPGALVVATVIYGWRGLKATSRAGKVFVGLAMLQLVAYAAAVVLPVLLKSGAALSSVGGAYLFPTRMAPAVGVLAVILAVAAMWRRWWAPVSTALVVGAGLLGLGLLLFQSRGKDNIWTYYPTKFAWLITVVFALLVLGWTLVLLSRLKLGVAVALVIGTVVAVSVFNPHISHYPVFRFASASPIIDIATDDFRPGDEFALESLSHASQEHVSVEWGHERTDLQAFSNFWTIMMSLQGLEGNFDLRYSAYSLYDPAEIEPLCDILDESQVPVVVRTPVPVRLAAEVEAACPNPDVTFVEVPELTAKD